CDWVWPVRGNHGSNRRRPCRPVVRQDHLLINNGGRRPEHRRCPLFFFPAVLVYDRRERSDMRSRITLLLGSLLFAAIRTPACAAYPGPSASLLPNVAPIWRQSSSGSTSQQTRLHQQKADAYLRDK